VTFESHKQLVKLHDTVIGKWHVEGNP